MSTLVNLPPERDRQERGKSPLVKRLAKPLRRRNLLLRPQELKELTRISEERPSFDNEIQIFDSGDTLYAQMLDDIAEAEYEILFEMYMVESDDTGWAFARALAERAQSGVTVRFIYDAVGSFNASRELFLFMASAGVHILEFRPIRPWAKRFGIFGRNHRKILVIDRRIGYVGGVNLANFWSETHCTGTVWRDTHARLKGEAALDLCVLFAETWHRETGALLQLPRRVVNHVPADPPGRPGGVFVIGARGRYRRRLRRLCQYEMEKTQSHLYLTNPYFVPDRHIRKALVDAAKRGVDVRILLPAKSDVVIADYAGRAFVESYLRNGIRFYFYKAGLLHAKTMIADRRWATIGSSNFDSLSFDYNLESNAILLDVEAVTTLEEQFWRDLKQSEEVTLENWARRSFMTRCLERLASLLKPWL